MDMGMGGVLASSGGLRMSASSAGQGLGMGMGLASTMHGTGGFYEGDTMGCVNITRHIARATERLALWQ